MERKNISVKTPIHERFRRSAAKLSTQYQRVSIAELVELLSKKLPEVTAQDVAALKK